MYYTYCIDRLCICMLNIHQSEIYIFRISQSKFNPFISLYLVVNVHRRSDFLRLIWIQFTFTIDISIMSCSVVCYWQSGTRMLFFWLYYCADDRCPRREWIVRFIEFGNYIFYIRLVCYVCMYILQCYCSVNHLNMYNPLLRSMWSFLYMSSLTTTNNKKTFL